MSTQRPRRGLVLLMVLSLLTLFTLLAVTFLIVTGTYEEGSKAAANIDLRGDPPEKLMDRAMYVVLRDTLDVTSPLRGASLLRDMYGDDGREGTVSNFSALPDTGNQFIQFDISFAGGALARDQIDGMYEGTVITFLNGPARNLSTRIVHYDYIPPPPPPPTIPPRYVVRCLVPKNDQGFSVAPVNGNRFLINGRAFNGTGVGYNDQTGKCDATMTPGPPSPGEHPLALLPNPVSNPAFNRYIGSNIVGAGPDESYDAADWNNTHLSAQIPNPTPINPNALTVVPSYHRPALINYWYNQILNTTPAMTPAQQRTLIRQFVLRPLPFDHPNFTGSNPQYNAFVGLNWNTSPQAEQNLANLLLALRGGAAWDVDNDGDGNLDSIWLDLGDQPMTAPNGRLYKPLYAFLIKDLDGRLNVNAHGNAWHSVDAASPPPITPLPLPPNGSNTTANLAGGPGEGPAEISLAGIVGLTAAQYSALINLREGNDNNPGVTGFDSLSQYRLFEYPDNYFTSGLRTSFGSPSDPRGRLAFALDFRGQPIYERSTGGNARSELPYEMDHSPDAPRGANGGRDALFSATELERLLRAPDHDAQMLPGRLRNAFNTFTPQQLRVATRTVTTDSYDPPVPSVSTTPEILNAALDRPLHVMQLLRTRLQASGVSGSENLNREIRKMLPYDLRRGLRWDINMPFGNGRDDQLPNPPPNPPSTNGTVDETGVPGVPDVPQGNALEATAANEAVQPVPGLVPTGVPFHHTNQIDVNNGGTGTVDNTDRMLVRQLYARYLYVLMMTLVDDNVYIPQFELDVPANGTTSLRERARGFAQWAINVVDFRDSDSIMTPFEYDVNPFNGWSANGIIDSDAAYAGNPELRVVWGCERPEMLITEAGAAHDRRTEDRDDEQPNSGQQAATTSDMTNPDGDYDQRLRPRGALFIELYNPWATPANGTPMGRGPWELYNNNGLVLTRRAPVATSAGATVGAPVWRMLVISGTKGGPTAPQNIDLNDPNPNLPGSGFLQNNVERGIYFVNPGDSLSGNQHGRVKYYSTNSAANNTAIAPLAPGRYAVIGPSYYQSGGDHITTFGRRTDANEMTGLNTSTTRRVVLRPNANPNDLSSKTVDVFNNATGVPALNNIQQPVAIVMDRPAGTNFSVSEPADPTGYDSIDGGATWVPAAAAGDGEYQDGAGIPQPIDTPLDRNRPDLADATRYDTDDQDAIMAQDGTTPRFRTIHLQRLANPRIPFHANRNPYITIDTSFVDLTAFNGLITNPADEPHTNAIDLLFASNQRGENATGQPRKLWKRESQRPAPTSAPAQETPVEHFFPFDLGHTFGFLNQAYGPAYNNTNTPPPPAGYTLPYDPTAARYYLGAPNAAVGFPFPWLTWNNRPFVSDLELMQVPFTRASQLLARYELPSVATSTYDPNPAIPPKYGHLLNFFHTHANNDQATHLYRLFEHTHVPSKYVSSDHVLNPNWFTPFQQNGMPNTNHTEGGRGTEHFHPPYNKVSNYRDPGRININTVYDENVWQSLFFHGFGPTFFQGPAFNDWVNSRRGYLPANADTYPTFFANPLRSFGAAELVPLSQMERAEVDCTLMRSNDVAPNPPSMVPSSAPLFEINSAAAHNNTFRNPYFRNQTLQRLSNLITSRSNVYAVWITVGYFEVDPANSQLGRELGSETGDVTRNRAFYIIDRSIPVAFEPGVNHNVDRAIRLRRFIE